MQFLQIGFQTEVNILRGCFIFLKGIALHVNVIPSKVFVVVYGSKTQCVVLFTYATRIVIRRGPREKCELDIILRKTHASRNEGEKQHNRKSFYMNSLIHNWLLWFDILLSFNTLTHFFVGFSFYLNYLILHFSK